MNKKDFYNKLKETKNHTVIKNAKVHIDYEKTICDVNVTICDDLESGAMFHNNISKIEKANTIRDSKNRLVYYIENYSCYPGLGCKFKIKDIVGE